MLPSHRHAWQSAACLQQPVEQLVIWPHRSLGRSGMRILVSSVGAAFSAMATWTVMVGAWPLLIYVAL